MELQTTLAAIFLLITALIALTTYTACRGKARGGDAETEYFLAGGSLKWYFVAGAV